MPALFTRPASPSSRVIDATSDTALAIDAASPTSRITGYERADNCDFRRAASSARRTPAKTRQPARSSRNAHASPMPVDAPVITQPRDAISVAEILLHPSEDGLVPQLAVQRLQHPVPFIGE